VVHVSAPVSETVSNPRSALSVPDPTQAQVPPQLWLRSGRPMFGTAVRVYVALALIAGALIFVPRGPVFWGMIGAGVLAFVLFPAVIQGLLAPLERRVLAAGRREATGLLQEVRSRGLVQRFAPHAWLTLQEGRLHLRRGDGRAAARAFTETLRLSRSADTPALISAQAQALVLAEQPEQARELLQRLGQRQALSAGDQLQLGLALLAGKGNGREILAHIHAAQAGLGDLPRVLAALALALHRADQAEAGLVALQRAQDSLGPEPDPFDEALVQRGVKLLRTVQKAHEKRDRKVQSKRDEGAARVAAQMPTKPASADEDRALGPAKSARKAKKDERRASRRAAKAEKRTVAEAAPTSKAAKVAPKGKAAKAIEPYKQKAAATVKPVAVAPAVTEPVAKPKDMAQETGSKPVAVAPAVPVAKPKDMAQETGSKPSRSRRRCDPVGLAPVAKPKDMAQETGSKPVAVAPVTKEPVGLAPVTEPVAKPKDMAQETGSKPVAVAPVAKDPVGLAPVAKPKDMAQETGSKPVAVAPVAKEPVGLAPVAREVRPEAPRSPAPPAGAALFGSVAAKPSGPGGPTFGAPSGLRLPPRPAASGPQPASTGQPFAARPAAPASPAAVPKVMSPVGAGAAAVPKVMSPVGAGAADVPKVMSPVGAGAADVPKVMSPVGAGAAAVPKVMSPLGASAADVPKVMSPVGASAPVLGAAPGRAPVLPPTAQSVSAPSLPAPPRVQAAGFEVPRVGQAAPPALAQVLPDTDDGWDDMLDALEADSSRR
jgi:hypothetical protein